MLCPRLSISLDAICNNYKAVCKIVNGKTTVASVLKANAYGLGAEVIAAKLYEAGCRSFWVAHINEAIALRRVISYDAEIFVLQGFTSNDISLLKSYRLTQVVNTTVGFMQIKNNKLPIVLFAETGLSRLGIQLHEIDGLLDEIKKEDVQYVMSHLGCASEHDHPQNKIQKDKFEQFISKIKQVKPDIKATLSASGGTLVQNYYYDMVRIGGALYGKGVQDVFSPEPVVIFEAPVIQSYTIPAGTPVGYDASYIAPTERRIALIAAGYADGVPYGLSNKGWVYFGSYKAPIIGKVAMDLTTCDVTDIPLELTTPGTYAEFLGIHAVIGDMGAISEVPASSILTGLRSHSNRVNVTYIG